MNEASVMFMLTVYNDHHKASRMLKTLGEGLLPGTTRWPGTAQLMILDATQPDHEDPTITRGLVPEASYAMRLLGMNFTMECKHWDDRPGLPECLNYAIDRAIDREFEYVVWIHPDMNFSTDPLWLSRCILWLQDQPLCGKVSPLEFKTPEESQGMRAMATGALRGNACPWVMRVEDCKSLREIEGWVFDPNYKLMHFEDWDLINRLQTQLGMTADIIPWAAVVHEGMGTRKHHDYEDSIEVNRAYYEKKWGLRGRHL
jgi:hypothetical protein